jgi:hypothetical protein
VSALRYKVLVIYLAVCLVALVIIIALSMGSDPSYCPSCPEIWKQQPWTGGG